MDKTAIDGKNNKVAKIIIKISKKLLTMAKNGTTLLRIVTT